MCSVSMTLAYIDRQLVANCLCRQSHVTLLKRDLITLRRALEITHHVLCDVAYYIVFVFGCRRP
jgi:hypothetical protein